MEFILIDGWYLNLAHVEAVRVLPRDGKIRVQLRMASGRTTDLDPRNARGEADQERLLIWAEQQQYLPPLDIEAMRKALEQKEGDSPQP